MTQTQRVAIYSPASKPTFFRGTIGLILGFAILLLAGAITVRTEAARRTNGESVRHTLHVLNEVHKLFSLVEGAESGERGYLITGNQSYLAPYEEARRNVSASIDDLADLIVDNPEQTKKLAELRPVVAERMQIISAIIDHVRAGKVQEAVELIKSGRGKELMDRIRSMVADIVTVEDRLLSQREAALASATFAVEGGVLFLIAVMFALAIFSIFQAQQQSSALVSSSEALQIADSHLMEETTRREAVEAKLRQAQKLEAIGQLTGGIAHDFNNMLSVVIASLNLLKRRLARGEGGYEQFINSAVDGAERAANLTHRLLAFSRTQPLTPSPIDANEFVAGMSNLLHRTLGEHVRVNAVLAKELWLTEADPNELENAVVNLAVNARDAMPNGGSLTIETANCDIDEAYASANASARPGQYVRLTVTDTGSGMAPETVARAFDPFFTTKAIGKGTGLGLSQVYGFVKQSGGHVSIDSEPGHGTSIKLYLPRYLGADQAVAMGAKRSERCPAGTHEEIVLVVEDEESARDVAVECLKELGYTVLQADSARSAMEILVDQPDITLLMTDIVMPGDNGAKLAEQARRRRPDLKVLFMSGYTRDAINSGQKIDPGIQFLSKPFTLDQAARKIRETLDCR